MIAECPSMLFNACDFDVRNNHWTCPYMVDRRAGWEMKSECGSVDAILDAFADLKLEEL